MSESRKYDNRDSQETRICLLEQSIGHINETLIRMEKRFDNIEGTMNSRFDQIERRFDIINSRMWSNFLWIMGSMGAMLALVGHALHWI